MLGRDVLPTERLPEPVVTATVLDEGILPVVAPPEPDGPPPARAHPTAVLATILAGAVATIALWWHDTPTVSGLGDWLTNAGRITGLLAGYGVVVLVALMARIPPLERGIGADRLARWHSKGGRYTVGLVVAHGLLIFWGYAVSAHTDVVAQTRTLLLDYPDVLAATVAGLLLVRVGISSARAARRRLRYETWYYVHFYTYLAVALAFSHQFATGAEFMDDVWARAAWGALYASVGAAIGWYRFVTPVRQAVRHRMEVLSVRPEGPGVVSVVIGGRHLEELRAESGQFFRFRFLCRGLWWTSSPYSLSAGPRPDRLRVTVKALGDHSAALAGVRPGTRVVAEGPYGAVTGALRRRRKVLLIGGGIGITPLRALFETLPAAPGDLSLVYRASDVGDIVFLDELRALARQRGANLRFVVGRRAELGYDPLSADALAANIPGLGDHDVYLCGPAGMTATVTSALRAAGVPAGRSTTSPSSSEAEGGAPMRRVILAAVSTIGGLVMLLSFKSHDVPVLAAPPAAVGDATPTTSTPTSADGTATTTAPGGSAASGTPSTAVAPSPQSGTVTVTGSAAGTRYGPVQVQITVTNGKVTDAQAVEYPTASARDRSINARAIPELNAEAQSAQSAGIDTVSGATYTSRGYITSLQSALDQAGVR